MEDSDIKHRFHLIQTEIEATASLLKDAKIDLSKTFDDRFVKKAAASQM